MHKLGGVNGPIVPGLSLWSPAGVALTRPGLSSGRSDLSVQTTSLPPLAGRTTILQREEGRESELLLAWRERHFVYTTSIS